jgi:RNase P subunit RPR2
MAIKIIGTDTTVMKRCTCRKCATMLEYTMADTDTDYSTDYTGGREDYRFLICPNCSNKVIVPMY